MIDFIVELFIEWFPEIFVPKAFGWLFDIIDKKFPNRYKIIKTVLLIILTVVSIAISLAIAFGIVLIVLFIILKFKKSL